MPQPHTPHRHHGLRRRRDLQISPWTTPSLVSLFSRYLFGCAPTVEIIYLTVASRFKSLVSPPREDDKAATTESALGFLPLAVFAPFPRSPLKSVQASQMFPGYVITATPGWARIGISEHNQTHRRGNHFRRRLGFWGNSGSKLRKKKEKNERDMNLKGWTDRPPPSSMLLFFL